MELKWISIWLGPSEQLSFHLVAERIRLSWVSHGIKISLWFYTLIFLLFQHSESGANIESSLKTMEIDLLPLPMFGESSSSARHDVKFKN